MPSRGSWDGKWSGEGKPYVVVRTMTTPPKLSRYSYDFGDGWAATVVVREVTSPAARKLRRDSLGFNGYDWMVEEIVKYGRIRTLEERLAACGDKHERQ